MNVQLNINIDDRIVDFFKRNLAKKRVRAYLIMAVFAASAIVYAASTAEKPYTFIPDDVIRAEEVNANFDTLYNEIKELAAKVQGVPAGTIIAYGGKNLPTGWLWCDGKSYNGASGSIYYDLYQAIGDTFGNPGANIFNVPDLRGIWMRGAGTNSTYKDATDNYFTAILGTYYTDQMQGHFHTPKSGYTYFFERCGVGGNGSPTNGTTDTIVDTTGSPTSDGINGAPRTGADTRPASLAVNYIIKY